jgi:guanylate kinase
LSFFANNRLFVLSAPSGAGKDTLLNRVLAACPEAQRCVTFTTRAPRPGETEGVDYHFVDVATFARMRDDGLLLEWAEVYGNFYGNSRRWVEEKLSEGVSAVLRIDVQGALTIRRMFPEAVLIFVAPPSAEEQERRLRSRETESEADVQRRLAASEWEMAQLPYFDYCVVNDDLEAAVDLVRCIIKAEGARILRSEAPNSPNDVS